MSQMFKEALRDLQMQKIAAEKALGFKVDFLYEKLPQIKIIDQEISEIGLHLAKLILQRKDEENTIKALRQKNQSLMLKREQLLFDNGYDDGFFLEAYACKDCKDTGNFNGGHCSCLKQRVISKCYEMSSLAKVLERENFDSFDINYYSDISDKRYGISPKEAMTKIWSRSLKFVENFDKKFENLLFYGPTGLGKTFLSNCIAKELLDNGKTVLYTTAAHLFKMVEDIRFKKSEADGANAYIDMAYNVDLLVIDDLGTEFNTVITSSELFSFINTRLLGKKHSIISTNLEPKDFEEIYGDRITSRLYGEYTMMRFFGDDIRIAKKHFIR